MTTARDIMTPGAEYLSTENSVADAATMLAREEARGAPPAGDRRDRPGRDGQPGRRRPRMSWSTARTSDPSTSWSARASSI